MHSQMKWKNHQPAKRILGRDHDYVIGVVDMCLCANHVVILIFHSQYSSKFINIFCDFASVERIIHYIVGIQIRVSNTSVRHLAALAI